jgi:hypothetical protein
MMQILTWAPSGDLSDVEEIELDCPNCHAQGFGRLQDRRYIGRLFSLVPMLFCRNTRVTCLRCRQDFVSKHNSLHLKAIGPARAGQSLLSSTTGLGSSLIILSLFGTLLPLLGLFPTCLALVHNRSCRLGVRFLTWSLLLLQLLWLPVLFGVRPGPDSFEWLGIQSLPVLSELSTAPLKKLLYGASDDAPLDTRAGSLKELGRRFPMDAKVRDFLNLRLQSKQPTLRVIAINHGQAFQSGEPSLLTSVKGLFGAGHSQDQLQAAFKGFDNRAASILILMVDRVNKGHQELLVETLFRLTLEGVDQISMNFLEEKLVKGLDTASEVKASEPLLVRLLGKSQNWELFESLYKTRPALRIRGIGLLLKVPGPESSQRLLKLYLSGTLPRTFRGACLKRFYESPLDLTALISQVLRKVGRAGKKRRLSAISLLLGMSDEAKKKTLGALVLTIGDEDLGIAKTALGIVKSLGPLPKTAQAPFSRLIDREELGWSTADLYMGLGPTAVAVFMERSQRGTLNKRAEGIQALANYGAQSTPALGLLGTLSETSNPSLARLAQQAIKKIRSDSKDK